MTTDIPTIADLTTDWIRRVNAYTDEITYFGPKSVGFAFARATAEQTGTSEEQYRAILRRDTLIGARGDALVAVAEEYGVPQLGAVRARTLVIVQPWVANVTAITDATKIEVDDSSKLAVNDPIRLTSIDGVTSETLTILSISVGTGPNGGNELIVGLIVNTYDPTGAGARVLLRRTLVAGTVFRSTAGVSFQSLTDVVTGDKNPVMAGESTALALADKVWCECTTPGEGGNVEALTVTSLQTADPDIRAVLNPGRAYGGADIETDLSLKYRAAHQPQLGAVETQAFVEALARTGNSDVLRAFAEDSEEASVLAVRVLSRSGGPLSTDALTALGLYMGQRLRSRLTVSVLNVSTTSIEVSSDVTLTPGPGSPRDRLLKAWRKAADAMASFLDWRKWPEGGTVDEADLLVILKQTEGIATVSTSSFLPAADTTVPAASVPVFTRLSLTDTASSETFTAPLSTSY